MKKLLVVAALLAGCATGGTLATQDVPQVTNLEWPLRPESWAREDGTLARFERDRAECYRDSGGTTMPVDGGAKVMYRYGRGTYKKCMEGRGWTDVHK